MSTPKNQIGVLRAIDLLLRHLLRRLPPTSAVEHVALWWGYRFQPSPSIVKLRSGALVKTTHVDHLQLLLYYLGIFEPSCVQAMKSHLRPGSTLLDVGANIGLFSIEGATAVGSSGNVIAIEAAPPHAQTIRDAAALNRLQNIEVVPAAVGSSEGAAILTLPEKGNYGMYTLGSVAGERSFQVPVRRIDDIVAGRRVDFIKIDIEGSEYQALLGAVQTLKSTPPLLIELNEAALVGCGSSARQVKQLLFSYGYQGHVLGSAKQITLDDLHVCDECLFLPTIG
ncbi:hypothetical protein QU42_31575 [Bradyrhizobium sp. UASWS1016]|nr:FkbM family methyltransferase [Bradyrhizobium sp. SK17]KIU50667.1 hypothetical protein QU41_08200 [Bradyrhizobium elkanii]OCX27244.1 hypothetical protein QU42_31575 [Bradyrhizobium sp. UASWS1016]